ncbi:BglG family transcription antiterminator [Amedibacillus sp. YH-ame6]
MSTKNNRMIVFLKLLMNHEGYMKSEELCAGLSISPRTLRDDITKYNIEFRKNGLMIDSKHGTGYRLQIIDESAYHLFIASLLKEEEDSQRLLPVYPEDRINYLIKLLLSNDDYVKLDDVADEIFISRSTLQNDMKEVRERLRFFHLKLNSKPAYGLRIEGSEMHKRSCISQYFFHTDTMDELFSKRNPMNEQQTLIRDILFETLDETGFRLSDIGFQNLIIHISIALQRVREQSEDNLELYQDILGTKEYEVAMLLVQRLNEAMKVNLKPVETCYIAIHLMGKKTLQYHREYAITQEIEELLCTTFDEIQQQYGYDFFSDLELYTVLALHFQPMLNRLRYGLPMQNPLLEDIKSEHHQAFEIAVLSADVITRTLHFSMSESEMGYLALHYALAMERAESKKQKKKNIIVVCASGAGSSQILMYKLRQRFQQQLQDTQVIEMYKLKTIDQSHYDFILTTVPIPFPTSIPVIQVQYFLNDADIVQLSDAFLEQGDTSVVDRYFDDALFFEDIEGKTKEEIITEMITRTSKVHPLPDMFMASVFEREQIASTEFGNFVAMPHPMKAMCDETFVSVGILKRNIRWVHQQVRYVFLMCVKKDETQSLQQFHEALATLVTNRSLMQEFEKAPTIKTLKDILNQQTKTQTNDNDIFQ